MGLNDLERQVIKAFLASVKVETIQDSIFNEIEVIERHSTEMGFLTEIKTPNRLVCNSLAENYRGGNIGAKLNNGTTNAGFLIYLEGHCISAVEGYDILSEHWPAVVSDYSLYLIDFNIG
ncbi:MAG TPA: hypothetical protein VE954_06025 [Oligoflexus sp.]|uniref:hypothetical protein n=1 Tax=Oligoflexus sp. TaxID=1971216 RepID=UPI002D65AB5F|nr:hypothetical protein [Oligoflexus sp.]HYX32651.1 hypothetical protein [Oligoflexus sp.]